MTVCKYNQGCNCIASSISNLPHLQANSLQLTTSLSTHYYLASIATLVHLEETIMFESKRHFCINASTEYLGCFIHMWVYFCVNFSPRGNLWVKYGITIND
jgi:hypothetical protein